MLVGMHITRLPEIRSEILRNEFHRYSCSNCEHTNAVEKKSIYTDFERKHYVGVELPLLNNWQNKVQIHRKAFEQSFLWGPPIAQNMGHSMITRVVFGIRALREKLIIWDAGLDDRIIEIGKKIVLDEANIDTKQNTLRVIKIKNDSQDILFGLYKNPTTQNVQKQNRLTVSKPLDTVTVFQNQITQWHRNSQYLIENHPWARNSWFVDAFVSDLPFKV